MEKLGSGAFGAVYRAVDTVLRREVALKVPLPASLRSEEAKARFLREPKAAAQLRHPNIVPVFDAGNDGDLYYIAYAYIDGRTLERALGTETIDYRRAAQLVLKLAEALDYAHGQQVVHRDVKPANVMLDLHGEPHLLDFGLARIESVGETVTQDGSLLGTPAFMSPEQAEGANVGPASDQYSLGVVLYQLLTGRLPFAGSPVQVLFQVRMEEPPPPSQHRPNIPCDLETICLKAMAKKQTDRYAACAALAADLKHWLDDEPLAARRASLRERAVRWSRKNRALAVLAATVATLAIVSTVAAVGFFAVYRRAEANFERAETALADLRQETEARRATEQLLSEREKEQGERDLELKRRDATITDKDVSLAERDRSLQQRDDTLRRLAAELTVNKQELERQKLELAARERELSAAVASRDAALSEAPRLRYVKLLNEAQKTLVAGDKEKASDELDACPADERNSEWMMLKAFAVNTAYDWEQTPSIADARIESLRMNYDGNQCCVGYASGANYAALLVETETGRTSSTFDKARCVYSSTENRLAADYGNRIELHDLDKKTSVTCRPFPSLGPNTRILTRGFPEQGQGAGFYVLLSTGMAHVYSADGSRSSIYKISIQGQLSPAPFMIDLENACPLNQSFLIPGHIQDLPQVFSGISRRWRNAEDVMPTAVVEPLLGKEKGMAPGDTEELQKHGRWDLGEMVSHPKLPLVAIGNAVYDFGNLKDIRTRVRFTQSLRPLAFNLDGSRLAVLDKDTGELVFYDSRSDQEWGRIIAFDKTLFPVDATVVIGDDLKHVVTAGEKGKLLGWGRK